MSFDRPRDPATDPERRKAKQKFYGGGRGSGKILTLEREVAEAKAEAASRVSLDLDKNSWKE